MIRPEFVKNYKNPLCSDAFSSFFFDVNEKTEHDNEIREATKYLETIVLPKYATAIGSQYASNFPSKLRDVFPKLIMNLHRNGINVKISLKFSDNNSGAIFRGYSRTIQESPSKKVISLIMENLIK